MLAPVLLILSEIVASEMKVAAVSVSGYENCSRDAPEPQGFETVAGCPPVFLITKFVLGPIRGRKREPCKGLLIDLPCYPQL